MYYLTLGSCLKGEESYMLDFVKYHKYIGVEKFVFLDRTYGPLYELFHNDPAVEIIHFPDIDGNTHQEAWGCLIRHNKYKTKWLALIDADQALVPVQTDNASEILKNYEDYASLQLNWKTFGSSYHENRLPGSVYERFLLTSQNDNAYNYHTQFICQPDHTLGLKTAEPHYPFLPDHELMVNTNKEQINANKQVALNPNTPLSFNVPALHDIMWIAHYTNKSKEEWLIKNSKGRADIFGGKMPLDQFDEYESQCNEIKEERVLDLWNKAK